MDFHKQKLNELCRACGEFIKKPNVCTTKGRDKTRYAKVLLHGLAIDISNDDASLHPSHICNPCHCKLTRWWQKRLKKSVAELTIHPVTFQAHSENCSVCQSGKDESPHPVVHPAFYLHRTEDSTQYIRLSGNNQVFVSVCVKIYLDNSWDVTVHGKVIPHSTFSSFSSILSSQNKVELLDQVNSLKVCTGNTEFRDLCRHRSPEQPAMYFKDSELVAYEETNFGEGTIRHTKCRMLVKDGRCDVCSFYRCNLLVLQRRLQGSKDNPASSFTPNKYLTTTQLKEKLSQAQKEKKSLKHKMDNLKKKLNEETERCGVLLGNTQSAAFHEVAQLNEKNLQHDPRMSILWDEQKNAMSRKDARGNRWHPALLKWCIALYAKSPSTYNMMRQSKFLILPHKNTLKSYLHYMEPTHGLSLDRLERIKKDIGFESLASHQRNVSIVFDEMRIKEGVVYKSGSGTLVGFVDQEDTTTVMEDLAKGKTGEKDPQLATHVLALMMRGITCRYQHVFAYFPTSGFSSQNLFYTLWPAVGHLESAGFRVRALVADGATPNRKFIRLHQEGGVNYTLNEFDPSRKIYFFCDVPHLIKTTRNNWENSHFNSKTRNLHYNKQDISWMHLVDLFKDENSGGNQLKLAPKLKPEHVYLNPSLRMKVKLAAQVLSSTVKNAMQHRGKYDTKSTEIFIDHFNYFFDCLNVSNQTQGNLNPALKPYEQVNDERFTWLEEKFLGFLREWEEQCLSTPNMSRKDQRKMCLSQPTLLGLRITVKSFVMLTRELLGEEGVQYILSEKFTQDPLEEYFSKHRSLLGHNTNPTLAEFGQHVVTLQVAGSGTIKSSIYGNCTNENRVDLDDLSTALPRRKRQRLH